MSTIELLRKADEALRHHGGLHYTGTWLARDIAKALEPMQSQSVAEPTPETDAALLRYSHGQEELVKFECERIVHANLAYRLERERNALTASNASLSAELERVRAQLAAAERSNGRLRTQDANAAEIVLALRLELTEAHKEADGLRELLADDCADQELAELLEDAARQACHTGKVERDYMGQVAGTLVTDSGAISDRADMLRRLAALGKFRIVGETGRMVVGYWPENDPQTTKPV